MKGKRILGIATAALAAVMCVGLVGCGGSGVDAKSVKGSPVTKEQFGNAFTTLLASENLTAEYSMVGTTDTDLDFSYAGGKKASGSYTRESNGLLVRNGGKERSTYTDKVDFSGEMKFIAKYMGYSVEETEEKDEEEQEEYYDKESGNRYTKNLDDEWETNPAYSSLVESQLSGLQYILPSMTFEDYEYDEKETGYVLKHIDEYNDEENSLELVIKFNQDGKLAAIYMKRTRTDYSVNREGYPVALTETTEQVINVVITYGDAETITLPTVKKEA